MRNKLIFAILLLLLFPTSSKAYCTSADKVRLRKLASNINTSYDYVEDDNGVTFNVTITNLNKDIYIKQKDTDNVYYYNDNSEIVLNGFNPGFKLAFEIYPSDAECGTAYLTRKYVSLPNYNKYYKSDLCKGKTFSICSKWANINMTEEEFAKKLKILEKEAEQKEEESKEPDTWFDIIASFIFDYYIFIALGITVIVVLIRYIINKRNAFDL